MKPNTLSLVLFVLLTYIALSPIVEAVNPPPDGGYSGFTTAEGTNALKNLTTGVGNTAGGWYSLFVNTAGNLNTANGAGTLFFNTGDNNTAVGALALFSNTTGSWNVANGVQALYSNTTGNTNTANGYQALYSNTTGTNNTAIGLDALFGNSTGAGNIALGANSGLSVTTASNVICIGANVYGNNANDSCFIGSIFNATSFGGTAVLVNSNGQLGIVTSSKRFKDDIRPMDKVSEALLALKPVTFRYKKEIDPAGTQQLGLVAEEVEKVNPDLIVRDKEGKPYSVRYDQVNAMLLNEFLKEHKAFIEEQRKVEKLEATVAQQHKDFEAALGDLRGQIQTVSAQLELNKPASQTVKNTD